MSIYMNFTQLNVHEPRVIYLGKMVAPGAELNGQWSEDGEKASDRGHDDIVTWEEREKGTFYTMVHVNGELW